MQTTYAIIGTLYQTLLAFATILALLTLLKATTSENTIHLYKIPLTLLAITSAIIILAYALEIFIAYYSGAKFEMEAFKLRFAGPYAWVYIIQIAAYFTPLILPFIRKNLTLTIPIILITFLASHTVTILS